jgi:hypothetical protein
LVGTPSVRPQWIDVERAQLIFAVAETRQVDSQLMGFLVEVAAFEAERLGGIGDVRLIALQLGDDRLAFEGLHAICERAVEGRLRKRSRACGRGERKLDSIRIHFPIGSEEQETLDNVAEFPDIARPGVSL